MYSVYVYIFLSVEISSSYGTAFSGPRQWPPTPHVVSGSNSSIGSPLLLLVVVLRLVISN